MPKREKFSVLYGTKAQEKENVIMNESIFKKIWNYSITVGQMIITAIVMAIVTIVVWLLCSAFRPKD